MGLFDILLKTTRGSYSRAMNIQKWERCSDSSCIISFIRTRNLRELGNYINQPDSVSVSFNIADSIIVSQKEAQTFEHMYFSEGGRGYSTHIHTGGRQSKKFSSNPKISLQLHCNPKISAHFILRNPYMNIKYPETMQIGVRIASSEPRNINITMFGVKKYHEHDFSFIWTQKYHF